jgi:hypothetical protein
MPKTGREFSQRRHANDEQKKFPSGNADFKKPVLTYCMMAMDNKCVPTREIPARKKEHQSGLTGAARPFRNEHDNEISIEVKWAFHNGLSRFE